MNHQISIQMKFKLLICCLLICGFGFSQSHKATISNIQKDGFHKIAISPEIRSASQDNLAYFRILDKNKKEVPFANFDNAQHNSLLFQRLDILSKTRSKDSITSIIISVNGLINTTELSLLISNTTINKTYSISGSNNQQDWFGLVSNQTLNDLTNANGTTITKSIVLPRNNYKFLRFDFNDKKSLPINVLEIGYLNGERKAIETINLYDFQYKISEDKKRKKSIITFSSNNFQIVDGISFDVKTKLFLRNASVFKNTTRKIRKRTENFKQEISSFNLNSNTSNSFQLNSFFEKEFTVEIDNQDNQPLDISKINVFQNTLSVITDLKANEKYEVIIDSTLSTPNYDLTNFTQNLLADLPKVTIINLKKTNAEFKNASEKAFWQQPVFLWSAILLAIAILGYFVISMLKEVDKK